MEIPMRTQLLSIIATIGLVGAAAVAAADSPAAGSTQTATWAQRKLLAFSPPADYVPANGYETNTHFISCDEIISRVTFVLQQLGARADDIVVDQRDCRRGGPLARSIDVSFSVLAPIETVSKDVAGPPLEARWRIVQLGGTDTGMGDCAFLRYVTIKVLPLFTTRNVKLIPAADCVRLKVGLRAEVLKMPQRQADSP
jgi:hypothetical protein